MSNTIMPNTKEKEEKCEMSLTENVFFCDWTCKYGSI